MQPTLSIRVVLTRGYDLLREARIDKPLVVIGRDPACDIVIDDIAVSKRHAKFECVGGTWFVEDLGSTNGLKVNGHAATRQALQHLDVLQIGNHRMHVFDDAMLPPAQLDAESTVQTLGSASPPRAGSTAKPPLVDTQPSEAPKAVAPVLGLKRVDDGSTVVPLDKPNTMIGESGQSAVLAWRRDALFLSRLSRDSLRVNGRDVGAGSSAIHAGDLIEVGAARYLVVTVDR